MAKLLAIGKPDNAGETRVFQYLREHLPDSYLVLTNVNVKDRRHFREVDAVILSSAGVQALEVKDWSGTIQSRDAGDWLHDGQRVSNPCAQTNQNAKIVRNFVFYRRQKIFKDHRVAHALNVPGVIVFANPRADTSAIDVRDTFRLIVCRDLDELIEKLLARQVETHRFLTPDELHKIALLLGAYKTDVEDWCQTLAQANGTAPSAEPPAPTPPPAPEPPAPTPPLAEPAAAICSRCSVKNRPGAKFCKGCGNKL